MWAEFPWLLAVGSGTSQRCPQLWPTAVILPGGPRQAREQVAQWGKEHKAIFPTLSKFPLVFGFKGSIASTHNCPDWCLKIIYTNVYLWFLIIDLLIYLHEHTRMYVWITKISESSLWITIKILFLCYLGSWQMKYWLFLPWSLCISANIHVFQKNRVLDSHFRWWDFPKC